MARRRSSGLFTTEAPAGSPMQDNAAASASADPVPPFFNITYSTHSLSPLYLGSQGLTSARLELLARRLRETLVGDVVRGIQIGLEAMETPSGQVGPLRAVNLRWFGLRHLLGQQASTHSGRRRGRRRGDEEGEVRGQEQEQESGPGGPGEDSELKGLWIEIRHENALYVALLLPSASSSPAAGPGQGSGRASWAMRPNEKASVAAEPGRFLHLPLMLMRMPQPLKAVLAEWLSTTFDCHVSKLSLGTRTIVDMWESWIRTVGLPRKGPDLVLTLAFNVPVPSKAPFAAPGSEAGPKEDGAGLRTMDISISPPDLALFLRAGKAEPAAGGDKQQPVAWELDARERRRLAGGNPDDGWAWRRAASREQDPFSEGLARYLDQQLALNLFHPSVRVVQISCGAFVLAQSRLKLMKPGEMTAELARGAWTFVTRLGASLGLQPLPSAFG